MRGAALGMVSAVGVAVGVAAGVGVAVGIGVGTGVATSVGAAVGVGAGAGVAAKVPSGDSSAKEGESIEKSAAGVLSSVGEGRSVVRVEDFSKKYTAAPSTPTASTPANAGRNRRLCWMLVTLLYLRRNTLTASRNSVQFSNRFSGSACRHFRSTALISAAIPLMGGMGFCCSKRMEFALSSKALSVPMEEPRSCRSSCSKGR